MRKPKTVERLYLDFDGFFASVMQQTYPALRNKPVGVVPFAGTDRTVVIACSRQAKQAGCTNVMRVSEAVARCPDLILAPQEPDLYRRAHNALISEINAVIPIDAIKSIDEITCQLDPRQQRNPEKLGHQIKDRIRQYIGPYITCSIGFAANRQLAKIAGKQDKPDGITIWHPDRMPEPLLPLLFEDIPGIGSRMARRLYISRIATMEQLLATSPKQLRKLWRNVTGERLWYALHGYDIQAPESRRGMFGHGRVLPPESRSLAEAREIARLLLIKTARRLRREGYYASGFWLYLALRKGSWSERLKLPAVSDDRAILEALNTLWGRAVAGLSSRTTVFRVHVTLVDLSPADQRQTDMFLNDDTERRKS